METYGALSEALTAASDLDDDNEDTKCNQRSEPELIQIEASVGDDDVLIALDSTSEWQITGQIELHAMSARERFSVMLPFSLEGLQEDTLRVSLSELKIDKTIDLAIVTVNLSGTLETGASTFAGSEVVYDRRTKKPELEEVTEPGTDLERVSVAIVSDGIAQGRISPGMTMARELSDARQNARGPISPSVNKTICFDAVLNHITNGIGEDIWTSTNTQVFALGQRIDAKAPGGSTYSTWWLDATGCISGNFATGTWTFKAATQTRILKGGAIWTILDGRRYSDDATLFTQFNASINSFSSQTVVYSASSSVNLAHTVHTSLNERIADLSFASFPAFVRIKSSYPGNSNYDDDTDILNYDSLAHNDKWIIAHEVGHYVLYNEAQYDFTVDYSLGVGVVQCSDSGHQPQSREFSTAAGVEGFGNYWAGVIFNNRNQSNCATRLAGFTVSCAGGDAQTPIRFMETQCTAGGVPFAGNGNESDWQRGFWDLTRADTAGTVPSVAEVLKMLLDGSGYSSNNFYQRVDAAAALAATPQYLENRWDVTAVANGIDN